MKTKLCNGITLATMIAMFGVTLTGCSNNEQSASANGDSDEVTTLRFSHFLTANDNINSLPDDLKKIIDDNSGIVMSNRIAKIFDDSNAEVMAAVRAKGDTMIDIPDPLNDPNWRGPLLDGTQRYLKEVAEKGLDGEAVYEQVKAASAACKV